MRTQTNTHTQRERSGNTSHVVSAITKQPERNESTLTFRTTTGNDGVSAQPQVHTLLTYLRQIAAHTLIRVAALNDATGRGRQDGYCTEHGEGNPHL